MVEDFTPTIANAVAYGISLRLHRASMFCIKLAAAKIASENQKIFIYHAKMQKRQNANASQKVLGNCSYTNALVAMDII